MAYTRVVGLGAMRLAAALCVSGGLAAFSGAASPVFAADAAADAAAPAKDAAAAPAKASPNWFKICEKIPFPDTAAKDPKTAPPIEKQVCATQFESFDPKSGSLLVSVAMREFEGSDKKSLLIGTPLGVFLPPGLALQFDDEKDETKFTKVKYDFCLPTGCNSETEIAADLLDRMGKAKVMRVFAVSLQGTPVPFKINMDDFATAMAGKPVDTAKYLNARKNLVLSLREKMFARQKAAQAAAAEAVKGVQEDAAATAAEDPAKKKVGN